MSGNHSEVGLSVDKADHDISLSFEAHVVLGILLVVTTVYTVIANFVTVYIFATDKAMQGFSDRLVLNLAVADGLIATFSMGMRVHLTLTEFEWIYGRTTCLIFLLQESWFNMASIVNTLMISLDHLLSLILGKVSYKEMRGRSLSTAMIFGPWVYTFLMFGLPIVVWKPMMGNDDVPDDTVCDVPFNAHLAMALSFLFLPFLPIMAVPVIDVIIFFLVRKIYKREVLEQGIKDKKLEEAIAEKASQISLHSQKLASEPNQGSLSRSTSLAYSSEDIKSNSVDPLNVNPNISSVRVSEEESTNASTVQVAPSASLSSKSTNLLKKLSFTPTQEEIAKNQNNATSEDRVKQSLHKIATAPENDKQDQAASSQCQNQNTRVKEVLSFARLFKESHLALSLGVVLAFTCLPFLTLKTIHDLCALFQLSCKSWIPNHVLAGCMWIVLINSSINPGVYFYADLRYRQGLYNFLGVKQKCDL